mgnify:CR=1 FL=1
MLLDEDKLKEVSWALISDLYNKFRKHGFSEANLLQIFGKEVVRYTNVSAKEKSLLRNHVMAPHQDLAILIDAFLFREMVDRDDLIRLVGNDAVNHLVSLGFFLVKNDGLLPVISIAPVGDRYFLNDGLPATKMLEFPVFPIFLEQFYLKKIMDHLLVGRPAIESAFELCSGSGVCGLSGPGQYSITGEDINPRAVAYARFNAQANDFSDYKYLERDSSEIGYAGEKVDLFTCNPPYNAYIDNAPEAHEGFRLPAHCGPFGDKVTKRLFTVADQILSDSGSAFFVATWLMKDGELAYPGVTELCEKGSLLLFHTPIKPINT